MEKIKEFGLSDDQICKFDVYYEMLIEYNEKYNLTAITEKKEVYIKHFYDSMLLGTIVDLNDKTLIDVGSGAGFPSIPLKILFPRLIVTIIDSQNKRISFLKELTNKLDIKVELVHGRAEEYARETGAVFDFATARAVARLNILLELCLPFLRNDGIFLCMKSVNAQVEVEEAASALKMLGGELLKIHKYDLPNEMGERTILEIVKKNNHNKKYPRQFAQIKKNPL